MLEAVMVVVSQWLKLFQGWYLSHCVDIQCAVVVNLLVSVSVSGVVMKIPATKIVTTPMPTTVLMEMMTVMAMMMMRLMVVIMMVILAQR